MFCGYVIQTKHPCHWGWIDDQYARSLTKARRIVANYKSIDIDYKIRIVKLIEEVVK